MLVHVTFIMEQHLGHQVLYQNLRRFIDRIPQISPTWVPITYTGGNSFWERLPFLPQGLRGSLFGRRQVQHGQKARPCDVLFFNTQVPAALLGGRLFRQPYIISTDITPIQYDQMGEYYGHEQDRFPLLKSYKHSINCKVFQKASYILPWSSWAADSLVKDYGAVPERIKVIPPGVDLEIWKPVPKEQSYLPVRILFVGGDLERKGGLDLMAAYQALPSGSAELILVTRSSVPKISGVTVYDNFEPNDQQLVDLYRSSDIFVLPTRGEAFGIAVVEASATGLPVIATPVGGLTDVVIDKKTGFLVPPGNRDALAHALRVLIENQEQRRLLGQAARLRAEKLFDARENANRIMEILIQIKEDT